MDSSNSPKTEDFDIARSLMVLGQYQDICRALRGIATIVPIKGIDLLQTLYADRMDRRVGDIDLVVLPAERLPEVVDKLTADGRYRLEFDFMADPKIMLAKKKASLLSCSPMCTDVDLHCGFITKKFFRLSCPEFEADAISRLTPEDDSWVRHMDPLDRWLFLAQHACFHMFSDPKWVRDLYLLQTQFSPEQADELQGRIKSYGFGRIALAVWQRMAAGEGAKIVMHKPVAAHSRTWQRFIRRFHSRQRSRTALRLAGMFYEFIHIEHAAARLKAYSKLILPNMQIMGNIYRRGGRAAIVLLYPFHALGSLILLGAFHAYYLSLAALGGRGVSRP